MGNCVDSSLREEIRNSKLSYQDKNLFDEQDEILSD